MVIVSIALVLAAVTFCIINIHTQKQTQLEKAQRESIVTTEIKSETTTVKVQPKPKVVRYQKKQTTKPETTAQKKETTQVKKQEQSQGVYYSASTFMNMGVINWNGWRWTWYSERVLPGNGLSVPGRHTDDNGYVCDESNYICLASSSLNYGTIIDTPLGKQGKIYDSGCDYDTIDVYVSW